MFYQLLFIHLYRPFLKYTRSTSPLPQHVSPRRLCTQAAAAISKLLRIYKKSYGLRQICNVAVYIAHSACTIHLLNLPERNARRDLIHGVRNLEEIAEGWLCARRTLRIIELSAIKWNIEVPSEVTSVFDRTRSKWGSWGSWDQVTSPSVSDESPTMAKASMSLHVPVGTEQDGALRIHPQQAQQQQQQQQQQPPTTSIPNGRTTYQAAPTIRHQMATNAPHARYTEQMDSHPFDNYPRPSNQPSAPTHMNHLHPTQSMTYSRSDSGPQSQQPHQRQEVINNINHREISCDNSNSSNSPVAVGGTPPMPVFNGLTENILEENQDWWMRDQSALALGLENWGEGWAGNQFMALNVVPDVQSAGAGANIAPPPPPTPDPNATVNMQPPHATSSETTSSLQVQEGVKYGYGYTNIPPSGY